MAFLDPKDLVISRVYLLTEVVEGIEVSKGDYYLISVEKFKRERFPVLGFSKVMSEKPKIFLVQAHAQFGDPTWRRAFYVNEKWEVYWPAGGSTWNHSFVKVEDSQKSVL